jgi:hypothetical protein
MDEKLDDLRKQIVELSRNFSFICPETAFIALPPELQRKYGITPQEYEAQQMYNFESMSSGGTPEPSEWALILLSVGLLIFCLRKPKKASV